MAAESLSTGTWSNPWSWMGAEAAWFYMADIKGGRLLRWQLLKAAAKERGYCGPTTQREIAENLEDARSAWLKWFSLKESNATWFHLKLDALLENKVSTISTNIGTSAPLLPNKLGILTMVL